MTIEALNAELPKSAQELAKEEVTFDISGTLAEHWERLEELRLRKIELDKEFEAYKGRFKEIFEAAGADRITLNGKQVATHAVSGALNEARLKREAPHIWRAYSVEVTERKLDRKALQETDPQTYENFRSRSLLFTDGAASH